MNELDAIKQVAAMLKSKDDKAIQDAQLRVGDLATLDRKDVDYLARAKELIDSKLMALAVDAITNDLSIFDGQWSKGRVPPMPQQPNWPPVTP